MPMSSPTSSSPQRTLCVLPALPERRTGGGTLLHELLAVLVRRGPVAVAVPVHDRLQPDLEDARRDPLFAGVVWLPFRETRVPGLLGYVGRMAGRLPSDVAKVATAANRAALESLRRDFRPTAELAVSSWALAAYPEQAFGPAVRLVMINVDPDVVRHDGPWDGLNAVVRKFACAIDRPKVRRLCRRALRSAVRVGAVSPADVPPLDALGGRSDAVYLPPLMRPRPLDRSAVEPGSVLITTNFGYQPNVVSFEWFLREVWPHVGRQAELTVCGGDPRGVGRRLCGCRERVRFVGLLQPKELDAAFARTAVAVNPTRTGSGFQVKLLDAVARGVPIVSTAWSNKLGPAIPASDDPREMARLITERLTPGDVLPFDYAAFNARAIAAWDAFLA